MIDHILAKLTIGIKTIVVTTVLLLIAGGGYTAYRFYDFSQNNPRFCLSCHLMKPAFDAWASSEHMNINCHECHHLNVDEMNHLMLVFIFQRPTSVPERHGKVIVPWNFCIKCHWDKSEKYPNAPLINESKIHAKHYFQEQIECSKCHGYIVHEFVPEERFCLKCHTGKVVHGTGMEELACLNCHTDKTANLRPDRDKCLFCHGQDEARKRLFAENRVDVRRFTPNQNIVDAAIKINLPDSAPMQFNCYECHKPHSQVRPDSVKCLECHGNIKNVGKHDLHISGMSLECRHCHKPHGWKVTEEQAKKECVSCHAYKSPRDFL